MSGSELTYVRNSTVVQWDNSGLPRPRPAAQWPMPNFPSTANSFLNLTLQGLTGSGTDAVLITTPFALPGTAAGQWTLFWTAYQGLPPATLSWNSQPFAWGSGLNQTIFPPNNSTVLCYLQRVEAGQTYVYAQATVTTPVEATASQNALAPSDQLALVNLWTQTLALKTLLDADGVSLSVSTTAYDAAVAALNTFLVTTCGAPANWYTGPAWPTTTFTYAGVKSGLATCWSNIATAQANLQAALNAAAAALTGSGAPTALGDGVTTIYLWGGGTVKINGVTTSAYTTAGGLLTFTTAPALDALLTGVSTNAQTGVNQLNSVNYLTNADKIVLMNEWNQELQTQTALDAQAVSMGLSHAAYDAAVTALSANLVTAGAPSAWATTWPDGTTFGPVTNIATNVSGWWATLVAARTALQNTISQLAQTGVTQINSVNYLTNADKISLLSEWNQELQTQTALDAQAVAMGISHSAYDGTLTTFSSNLVTAGAPSGWATSWPDGTTFGPVTGITTSLATWWANIVAARTALQNAISQLAQTGVTQINSVNYLTNIDKIDLMAEWVAEKSIQTSLDAQAVASLGSGTTAQSNYDAAVLAVDTYLGTTLGYSTWKTTWPDGVTINVTGINTTLQGLWNTVASTRSLLQQALDAVGLQALARASTNAPAVGLLAARPTLPNVAFPAGTYYYATDSTAGDGNAGTLYQNVSGTWTVVGGSVLTAGRIVAANITAGSIGAAALAASIIMTTVLLANWTAGTTSAAPVGIKLSGPTFTSYFLDGTNTPVNMEIGGPVNLQGYLLSGLAIGRLLNGGVKVWNTPGTYTWVCPPGITVVEFTGQGAGGSGNSTTTDSGGGAGAYIKCMCTVVPGTSYTIVVGAGGASVTSTATGNNGAATTVTFADGAISCGGGSGAASGAGGHGGALTSPYCNSTAFPGQAGSTSNLPVITVSGGANVLQACGGCAGGYSTAFPGSTPLWTNAVSVAMGGASCFGLGGAGGAPAATAYGAGGGGVTSGASGKGAGGYVMLRY